MNFITHRKQTPINLSKVVNINKVNISCLNEYWIEFKLDKMSEDNNQVTINWKFNKELNRNLVYDKIKKIYGKEIKI